MTAPTRPDLPLDLPTADVRPPRRWFRKRYMLVLLVPVLMFSGAVMGMYYQPPGLQKFYALTGLQPGAGSDAPIALPPDIELPPKIAETMLPTDVIGLARVMPRGDVSVVAAPYGSGDARLADAGGAQRAPKEAIDAVGKGIEAMLKELSGKKPDALVKDRRAKFLDMGSKGLAA